MRTVDAVPRSRGTNILSKTDTNETLRIRFPVKAWLDAYPDCVIQLIHRRSQDPDGLPAAVLETDGVYAYWLITDSDTAYAGDGEAELRMQSGTAVSKSETYDTHVVKSVGSSEGPAPEPVERVAEQIAASAAEAVSAKNIAVGAAETAVEAKNESVTAANRAEDAAEAAETASTHGPTISEDGTWLVWDAEQGQYVDTGVIAEGHDGQDGQDGSDGISPEVTFSTIEGGHSMTVTDREHPDGQTISIMDGADGEVPIDDTTPAADKVFSSAKVSSEITTINQAIAEQAKVNAEQARVLENLKIAATGKLFNYVDDTDEAYKKTLPVGVLPNGLLTMIGGKTIVTEDDPPVLVSAPVTDVVQQGKNLYDKDNPHHYTTNGSGVTTEIQTAMSTGYIDVGTNEKVSIGGISSDTGDYNLKIVFFDANKSFISRPVTSLGTVGRYYATNVSIPANARYVMFQYTSESHLTNAMACFGTDGTYKPYNLTHHYIPSAVQALDGYGWSAGTAYNSIEYDATQNKWFYHKRVGSVDLGTLTPYIGSTMSDYGGCAFHISTPTDGEIICSNYAIENNHSVSGPNQPNKSVMTTNNIGDYYPVRLKDSDFIGHTSAQIKESLSGVMLYYELNEEVVTDITSLMPEGFHILTGLEAGGTLTFVNSNGDNYRIPVPSVESYEVSVQEVLSNG